MNYSYDFHIHSALSPCAEDEMTPNNIVNMAVLNGLDIIAVADHNSPTNLPAFEKCARDKSLLFIPGIEVESVEEVHISCLFADLSSAMAMGEFVEEHLQHIENDESVLGAQHILDAEDNVIAKEERMLLFSTDLTSEKIFEAADRYGGCAYFSHVDRTSYSVLSVLGAFPGNIGTGVVEVSNSDRGREFSAKRADLKAKTVLYCSDAHRLADISKGENIIDFPIEHTRITACDVINWIKNKSRG